MSDRQPWLVEWVILLGLVVLGVFFHTRAYNLEARAARLEARQVTQEKRLREVERFRTVVDAWLGKESR